MWQILCSNLSLHRPSTTKLVGAQLRADCSKKARPVKVDRCTVRTQTLHHLQTTGSRTSLYKLHALNACILSMINITWPKLHMCVVGSCTCRWIQSGSWFNTPSECGNVHTYHCMELITWVTVVGVAYSSFSLPCLSPRSTWSFALRTLQQGRWRRNTRSSPQTAWTFSLTRRLTSLLSVSTPTELIQLLATLPCMSIYKQPQ